MIICSLSVWLPVHLNNQRLATFASNLYNYPLPAETVVIERRATLGKVGNGNNCWYRAEQSMKSTLSVEEISNYYNGVVLPKINFGGWVDNYSTSPETQIDLKFDEVSSIAREIFFTLELLDDGSDITLDYRCH